MSDIDREDLSRNIRDKDTWLRLVNMILFGVASYVCALITFAIAVVQFLSRLFSGGTFAGLSEFGTNLATYQSDMIRYLTFASDNKPFPFAKFPESRSEDKGE